MVRIKLFHAHWSHYIVTATMMSRICLCWVMAGLCLSGTSLRSEVLGWGSMTLPHADTSAQYNRVAAAWYHGLAVTKSGNVLAWGRGDSGQCNVIGLTNALDVAGGEQHSAVLFADGTVGV